MCLDIRGGLSIEIEERERWSVHDVSVKLTNK